MSLAKTATAPPKKLPWPLIVFAIAIVALLIGTQLGQNGLGGESINDKIRRLNDHGTQLSAMPIQKWLANEPLQPEDRADLNLAAVDFQEILKLNDKAWDKRFTLAAIYGAQEEWDQAAPYIDSALANPPSNPTDADKATLGELHFLNSQRWFLAGKPDKAEQEATAAIKVGDVEAYYYARAQARAQLHKLEEAQQDCQQALKLDPNDERVTSLIKFMQNMR